MSYWIPKPARNVDPGRLQLDEKERLVLSRVDGSTSVAHLGLLPGLSPRIVGAILERLVELGVVEPEAPEAPPQAARPAVQAAGRLQPTPSAQMAPLVTEQKEPEEPEPEAAQEPAAEPAAQGEQAQEEAAPDQSTVEEEGAPAESPGVDTQEAADLEQPAPDVDEPEAEEAGSWEPEEDETASEAADDVKDEAEEDQGPAVLDEVQLANYRKLYETQLKHMTRDQRISLAATASGEVLYALCYDGFPGVIEAILTNKNCGLNHGRMIARYHDKGMGLEHLARRSQLLSDGQVQRHLLRNVQTPAPVLKRMLRAKPLIKLYKLNFSRELSDPATRAARQGIRSKFQTSQAEETVGLVFSTEGRCLQMLSGIPLDEQFVALFTKRPINSMVLIQSILRHAATPPAILRHLWKQPLMKRQRHLRDALIKHPNCPGEYKRPGFV